MPLSFLCTILCATLLFSPRLYADENNAKGKGDIILRTPGGACFRVTSIWVRLNHSAPSHVVRNGTDTPAYGKYVVCKDVVSTTGKFIIWHKNVSFCFKVINWNDIVPILKDGKPTFVIPIRRIQCYPA